MRFKPIERTVLLPSYYSVPIISKNSVTLALGLVILCLTASASRAGDGFVDFNFYPELMEVNTDSVYTVNAFVKLPARLSYFSLTNFNNADPSKELSDRFTYYTEQNLRWAMREDLPLDLTVQHNLRSGSENDRLRLGIGIPPDERDKLFSKFSQVDASHTRRHGGTGLGLVISRQLAEMMGGKTGVVSPVEERGEKSIGGPGTEFWFTVRLAKQEGVVTDKPEMVELEGLNVLVVDDNASNREYLSTCLKSQGMKTQLAENGAVALEMIKPGVFDLAIIDMEMPNMTGLELAQRLQNPKPKLVMLTSVGGSDKLNRCEQEGLAGHISKPVRREELFQVLLKAMSREVINDQERGTVTLESTSDLTLDFSGRDVRILLAEDIISNQYLVQAMLKTFGVSCDVANNGQEAVEFLKSRTYDLVLMDMQMPVMDGMEATCLIRDAGSGVLVPDVPIIAVTANAMEQDRQKCIEIGMNDYLTKPISKHSLAAVLRRWLPESNHP